MARSKLLLSAAALLALAAIAVLWGMQYQARLQLRDQADSLQEQLKRLGQLEVENIRLSNIVVRANTPLAEVQLAELAKLREQVERFRNQTNQIQNLKGEIARLRNALSVARKSLANDAPPDVPAEDIFPRDSWAFAGYDTPEAALQSVMWAIGEGDQNAYMDSLSPDLREEMEAELADGNFADSGPLQLGNTTGFRILDRDAPSDNERIMTIYLDGDPGIISLILDYTNSVWGIAGVDGSSKN